MLEPRRLQVPPTFVLPSLDDVDGVAPVVAAVEDRRLALHDTERLDLTRSGVRVAHEPDHGWQIELPEAPSLDRTTVRLPGGPSVPSRVAKLVRAISGDRPLRRLVRMDVRAVPVLLVVPGDDEPVLVVADEEVSIHEQRRLVARFRELVVRPGTGATRDRIEAVTQRLTGAGAVVLPPGSSRLVDVLGPRAAAPPDVVAPSEPLGEDATVRALVASSLAQGVRAVERSDPHARLGRDPEGVHQLRVALRRLRSTLRTWRRELDPDWTGTAREELAWAADSLGAVRDVDVLRERVTDDLDALKVPDPPRRELLRAVADRAEAPRAELRQVLDGDRYLALLGQLRRAALDPPVEAAVAGAPAREVLPPLVARSWSHLADAVATLPPDPADAQLHQLRRRVRRLRDASAAAGGVVGKPARRLADAADEVQQVLGEHQDAAVTMAVLGELAAARPDLAFTCGQVAGLEHGRAQAARAGWGAVWAELDRRKLRRWTDPSG